MTGTGGRRAFLAAMVAGATTLRAQEPAAPAGAQRPAPGGGSVGTLGDPSIVGRSRTPTAERDNDREIQAVEQRLACTCGCTLDIFTCRTTDFTCTYSPELHREVVALHEAGKTPDEIVDAFVAKYGEKALMAPKPAGFNLMGYLVPGVLLLLVGGVLVWFLRRRARIVGTRRAAEGGPATGPRLVVDASDDELARLERELAESER